MRRFLVIGLLLVAGCEDDEGGTVKTDASAADAAVEMGPAADAGADMPPATTWRLERPTDLPRPPNGRLPADLLPPTR
jgi:hypothetical protein